VSKNLINLVSPPALPLARDDYDRPYQDQLNNILRLYFVQLNAAVNAIVGETGGRFLQTPYAAIQRTTDKTFTANTATQITFDQNDYLNGCANDGTDGIAVTYNGLYNYQFSVQLKNTDSQIHSAWIWLRVNNVDVPGTGSKFDVISSHGGTPGYVIAACNFYVDLVAGDTVEMWAAVNNVAVSFEAEAAQTSPFPMPAIPSVVATLSFVSSYEA
jgi:hypothetical protein